MQKAHKTLQNNQSFWEPIDDSAAESIKAGGIIFVPVGGGFKPIPQPIPIDGFTPGSGADRME